MNEGDRMKTFNFKVLTVEVLFTYVVNASINNIDYIYWGLISLQ